MVALEVIVFNLSLGAATLFSPCGIPMLPAYLAYYLGHAPGEESRARALARGVGGGLLVGVGAFVVLFGMGLLAIALGAPFKSRVQHLELLGGIVMVVLGILTLTGKGPRFKVALKPTKARGALSLVSFGALYAGVAAGCVVPLLLAVLTQVAQAPTAMEGALIMTAYAGGMGGLLVGITAIASMSQNAARNVLRAVTPYMEKAAGTVMLLVGVYLVAYWTRIMLLL